MLSTTSWWSSSEDSPDAVTAATTPADPFLLVGRGTGQDTAEENQVVAPDIDGNSVALGDRAVGDQRAQAPGVVMVKAGENEFFLVLPQLCNPLVSDLRRAGVTHSGPSLHAGCRQRT